MEKTQPDARDSRFFGFITTLDGRRLIEAWLCSHAPERFWYAPSSKSPSGSVGFFPVGVTVKLK